MAETASGGGCLTINSTNLAAIENGLGQLITDDKRYEKLLAQLNSRKLRTWQDYAADIRDQLCKNAGEIGAEIAEISSRWTDYQLTKQLLNEFFLQLESSDPSDWREIASDVRKHLDANDGGESATRWVHDQYGKQLAEAGQKSFHIDLNSLNYHDEYLKRGKAPIFDQKIIRYRRENFTGLFKKIREPHLFYGPYIALESGRYMFSIDGDLTGSVAIKFMKDHGTLIRQTTLTTFNETLALDLPEPIANFEIVAEKTDQTEALEIRSIFVEFIPPDSHPYILSLIAAQ